MSRGLRVMSWLMKHWAPAGTILDASRFKTSAEYLPDEPSPGRATITRHLPPLRIGASVIDSLRRVRVVILMPIVPYATIGPLTFSAKGPIAASFLSVT